MSLQSKPGCQISMKVCIDVHTSDGCATAFAAMLLTFSSARCTWLPVSPMYCFDAKLCQRVRSLTYELANV